MVQLAEQSLPKPEIYCSNLPVWPDGNIIFHSMAVYIIENSPSSMQKDQSLPNSKPKQYLKCPKDFLILPKWQDFVKSGRTANYLVFGNLYWS